MAVVAYLFVILMSCMVVSMRAIPLKDNYRDSITAVVILGDSTVDVGVNNYVDTIVRCNWEPYGRIFQQSQGKPTGRFCDGKIAIDVVVEKIGHPLPLPYLAPYAHGPAILTGINVASGASGWYDLTATRFNVKTTGEQIEWTRNWYKEVISLVGQERGDYIIKNTLHIISTGANDWVNNYYVNPTLLKQYTPDTYTTFIIGKARAYIQELYEAGGRNIGVLGLPPLGCIPAQITIYGKGKPDCIERLNNVALNFNAQFKAMMKDLEPSLHGGRLIYIDSYTEIQNIVSNPSAYGISEVRKGCCGTGLIETGFVCNKGTPGTCSIPNGSAYLWWDSFHPTEHANYFLGDVLFQQTVPFILGPAEP